ncbi:hypothetical protein [Alistipes indistinctus]|uniref:hypothetical protein n=1 Tax=Alistipes indistinctus TaxID=626932 RepID=UPI0036F36C83
MKNLVVLYFGICACFVFTSSCTRETPVSTSPVEAFNKKVPHEEVPPLDIDEYMSSDGAIYAKAYEPTDFFVQMGALKATPLDQEVIFARSGQRIDCSQTKSQQPLEVPHQIFINGLAVNNTGQTKSSMKSNDLRNFYGTEVTYEFLPLNSTKGETSTPAVISQYVPQLVEITSPRINTEKEMYPVCYVKNFVLRWNADPNNHAGLLISIDWMGKKLFGPDNDGQSVRRTAFIPEDNGEITLDPQLFNHIPNTALVFITLLRGNIDNVLVGDYSYNISSESHAVLPIILCRKLRNIQ